MTATTIMRAVSVAELSDKTRHVKQIWVGEMPDGTQIETAGLGQDDFGKNWADFAGSGEVPYGVEYAAGGQMRECLEGGIGAKASLAMQELPTFHRASWQAR